MSCEMALADDRTDRYLRGELSEAEQDAFEVHVLECADCGDLLEAARVAREVLLLDRTWPAHARSPQPGTAGARRWWGLAAAAVLVAGLGLSTLFVRGPGSPLAVTREGDADTIRSLVPEDQPLTRDQVVLRWSAGPPGATYLLRVATEELTPVYEARDLTAPEHAVPARALNRVPPGARLLWHVEQLNPDGSRTTSQAFFVRVE